MTPEALATLHARCFDAAPRPWSAGEFARLIQQPEMLLLTGLQGFALGRVAGPEAELLTIAVAPEVRRQGIAGDLLRRFEAAARSRGATEGFLEVAETNAAARAFYAAAGYDRVGCRPRYYAVSGGGGIDALVLRKEFAARAQCAEASAPVRKTN